MELTTINNVIQINDFDTTKQELALALKKYEGYVLTDTSIAKQDRAYLNKLKDAIETKRKEAKKLVEQQYKELLEPQCKELVAMIESVSSEIDKQVKEEEEKERAIKLSQIEELAKQETEIDILAIMRKESNMSYGRTKDWLNKSKSISAIKKDIEEMKYYSRNERKVKSTFTIYGNIETLHQVGDFLRDNAIKFEGGEVEQDN